MRISIKALVTVLLMLYPFLTWFCISHYDGHVIGFLLLALGSVKLVFDRSSPLAPLCWLAILCGVLSLIQKNIDWLKLYPVLMSMGALSIFLFTLYYPPSIIERFARVFEPNLPESGVVWTRKVTKVWCVFFVFNATLSLYTVYFSTIAVWSIYNGIISYILMGILFVGEFLLRKFYRRHEINHEKS